MIKPETDAQAYDFDKRQEADVRIYPYSTDTQRGLSFIERSWAVEIFGSSDLSFHGKEFAS